VYLFHNDIKNYINKEKEILDKLNVEEINSFINILLETVRKNGVIYICGNGGSASTASHFMNDFNKGVESFHGNPFRFMCLSDNIATITAIANDISYDEIYSHQLKNRLNPNDIVIGISGSGNSSNIINAIKYANQCGNTTISLTGYDGGKLKHLTVCNVHIPVNNMQIVEDIHLILDHLIMYILSQKKGETAYAKKTN
jgi:D-sedoheptulose 7-phosphate isomerase